MTSPTTSEPRFLWLGSAGGLYRFDGLRFEHIDALGTSRLPGVFISALTPARSGGLWIGYIYGGVSYFDGITLTNYPIAKGGLPAESVAAIEVDAEGVVWAGTTRGLARANNIETEIRFGETDFRVRVRDDGIGVDPEILREGRLAEHWGLPGMRERSENIGGHLSVWSEKKAGTEVELRISAGVAYALAPKIRQNWLVKMFHPSESSGGNVNSP